MDSLQNVTNGNTGTPAPVSPLSNIPAPSQEAVDQALIIGVKIVGGLLLLGGGALAVNYIMNNSNCDSIEAEYKDAKIKVSAK